MNNTQEPIFNRRDQLPDGTISGPQRGPWARWNVESHADKLAGLCLGVAILLSATSLFFGGDAQAAGISAYPMMAPIGGSMFLLALVSMFLERERHGLARVLIAVGSAFLAVVALWYGHAPSVTRLVIAYWIPALLGVASILILAWSQRVGSPAQRGRRSYREQRV